MNIRQIKQLYGQFDSENSLFQLEVIKTIEQVEKDKDEKPILTAYVKRFNKEEISEPMKIAILAAEVLTRKRSNYYG